MHRYEITFIVQPAYAFGLPDEGCTPVPHEDGPKFHIDPETARAWITRLDDSDPSRRDDEKFQAEFWIDGIQIIANDNVFRAILYADSREIAELRASQHLQRLFFLFQTTMNGPSFRFSSRIVAVRKAGVPQPVDPDTWHSFFVYNNAASAEKMTELAALLNQTPGDSQLDRALRYFSLGDALTGFHDEWESQEEISSIAPVRFLQYWKALAVVVGDPAKDKDYQSRSKKLGLGRQFFRQTVKKMHDIRNDMDVAHIAGSPSGNTATHENAEECRRVAKTAIDALIDSLITENV